MTMTTHPSLRGTDPTAALPFLAQLDRVRDSLPGTDLDWLTGLRADAQARFAEIGLPTQRVEAWKYTSLRALNKLSFEPATANTTAIDSLPTVFADGEAGPRLVFVNGHFRAELSRTNSLPAGVTLASLGDTLKSDPAFLAKRVGSLADGDMLPMVALNSAFLAEGAVLRVASGIRVEQPIELVYLSVPDEGQPTVFHPRNLVVIEEKARAVVVEHHVSVGNGVVLANHVTEIFVNANASLHHYKIQRENGQSFHLAHAAAKVAPHAVYDNFILTMGARLSRNEVVSRFGGEYGQSHVSGAYMVRDDQHVDTTTLIDHAMPNCTSREVYKGAIDDHARGVFQGKIIVRPDAQKTDGYQQNRALLLSDNAEIDAKPELEIYADDVKCSHGATVGELDEQALFYLRARGIDKETARGLLINAFLAEALDEISEDIVRDHFQQAMQAWLAAR